PGSLVAVTDVSGRSIEEATALLAEQALIAVPGQDYSREIPTGQAIGTDPPAGTRLDKDSKVTVVISLGPASRDVTALTGLSVDAATAALADIFITPSGDSVTYFTDAADGTVIGARVTP
ncbi:PASTA domain-containing protein, partial [Rhizobium johnstonii]